MSETETTTEPTTTPKPSARESQLERLRDAGTESLIEKIMALQSDLNSERQTLKAARDGLDKAKTALEGYGALGTVEDLQAIKATAETASTRAKQLEGELLSSQIGTAYPGSNTKVLRERLGDVTPTRDEDGKYYVTDGETKTELKAWLETNHADYVPAIFPSSLPITAPPAPATPKTVATLPAGTNNPAIASKADKIAAQRRVVQTGF